MAADNWLTDAQLDGRLPSWEAFADLGSSVSHPGTPDQSSIALILLIICKEHLQSKVALTIVVFAESEQRAWWEICRAGVRCSSTANQ